MKSSDFKIAIQSVQDLNRYLNDAQKSVGLCNKAIIGLRKNIVASAKSAKGLNTAFRASAESATKSFREQGKLVKKDSKDRYKLFDKLVKQQGAFEKAASKAVDSYVKSHKTANTTTKKTVKSTKDLLSEMGKVLVKGNRLRKMFGKGQGFMGLKALGGAGGKRLLGGALKSLIGPGAQLAGAGIVGTLIGGTAGTLATGNAGAAALVFKQIPRDLGRLAKTAGGLTLGFLNLKLITSKFGQSLLGFVAKFTKQAAKYAQDAASIHEEWLQNEALISSRFGKPNTQLFMSAVMRQARESGLPFDAALNALTLATATPGGRQVVWNDKTQQIDQEGLERMINTIQAIEMTQPDVAARFGMMWPNIMSGDQRSFRHAFETGPQQMADLIQIIERNRAEQSGATPQEIEAHIKSLPTVRDYTSGDPERVSKFLEYTAKTYLGGEERGILAGRIGNQLKQLQGYFGKMIHMVTGRPVGVETGAAGPYDVIADEINNLVTIIASFVESNTELFARFREFLAGWAKTHIIENFYQILSKVLTPLKSLGETIEAITGQYSEEDLQDSETRGEMNKQIWGAIGTHVAYVIREIVGFIYGKIVDLELWSIEKLLTALLPEDMANKFIKFFKTIGDESKRIATELGDFRNAVNAVVDFIDKYIPGVDIRESSKKANTVQKDVSNWLAGDHSALKPMGLQGLGRRTAIANMSEDEIITNLKSVSDEFAKLPEHIQRAVAQKAKWSNEWAVDDIVRDYYSKQQEEKDFKNKTGESDTQINVSDSQKFFEKLMTDPVGAIKDKFSNWFKDTEEKKEKTSTSTAPTKRPNFLPNQFASMGYNFGFGAPMANQARTLVASHMQRYGNTMSLKFGDATIHIVDGRPVERKLKLRPRHSGDKRGAKRAKRRSRGDSTFREGPPEHWGKDRKGNLDPLAAYDDYNMRYDKTGESAKQAALRQRNL